MELDSIVELNFFMGSLIVIAPPKKGLEDTKGFLEDP